MEKYINEKTIVKNETYDLFHDNIVCHICECLMIEPVMCLGCTNKFCKKCIESWKKKSQTCPNRCENTQFKDVIEKNNLITKFKFKCIKGCGEEIPFNDIKNHYNSDCLQKKKGKDSKTLKILTIDEVSKLKLNKEIEYIESKY